MPAGGITLETWGKFYKTFFAVTYRWDKLAQVFVPCRPIQFSPMFAGKARRLVQMGAPKGVQLV